MRIAVTNLATARVPKSRRLKEVAMSARARCFACCLSLLALGGLSADAQTLLHRYSFNDGTANDSVGTANGTLNGGAMATGGQLVLVNTTPSADSTGQFVNLPANMLPTTGSVSFETWFTADPMTPAGSGVGWERLFDFGNTDAGGNGQNYIFVTPASGPGDTRAVISDTDPGFNDEELARRAGTLNDGMPHYIAAVFDETAGKISLYVDNNAPKAQLLDQPLSVVQDQLSYLGRSLYNGDPLYNGSIDEMRIWGGALTPAQVAADFAAGPDGLPNMHPLVGDFNGDGKVDFADLLILAQNYGLTTGAMLGQGDANADGGVGFDDLLLLAQHYGDTAMAEQAGAVAPVPEPASMATLALAAGATVLRPRRRR